MHSCTKFASKRALNFPCMAAMASRCAATAASACHAFLNRLGTNLQRRARDHSVVPAASTVLLLSVALAVLILCGTTALVRVVVFFLPLVASTSICCAAAYLHLVAGGSEGGAAEEEVVLLPGGGGGRPEVGLLQVYGEANASAYGGRRDVQVGCFLHRRPGAVAVGGGWTKRGVDEEGEDVVFAGRLATTAGGGAALEEELVALQVDRIAEGVWDSYFGGCSRWNHYVSDGPDDEAVNPSSRALLDLT